VGEQRNCSNRHGKCGLHVGRRIFRPAWSPGDERLFAESQRHVCPRRQEVRLLRKRFSKDQFDGCHKKLLRCRPFQHRRDSIDSRDERASGRRRYENLCRVFVDYYTPAVPTPRLEAANWFDTVLGPWTHYFALAGSLLGIRLWTSTDPIHDIAVDISQLPNRKCSYAVVSLNYDLVLEYMSKAINAMTTKPGSVKCYFGKPDDDGGAGEEKIIVPLAKLHGSTHTRHVIAPTWNKGLESDSTIVETWATALKLLREANHIRIIGYSLPESDAYIRYLLKAAVIESPHLKSFDVICSDSSGQTRERYKAFVTFKYFRFAHGLTQDYLSNVFERKSADIPSMSVTFDGLERAHEDFIEAALT